MSARITAIDHTGITVSDLERSLEFWHGVLGCPVVRRGELQGEFAEHVTGVPGAVISTAVLDAWGHHIELLQYHVPGAAPVDRSAAVPGSKHVAFRVDDLDTLVAELAGHGWSPAGQPVTKPYEPRRGSRFVYLRDPDGTTLEFIQPAE